MRDFFEALKSEKEVQQYLNMLSVSKDYTNRANFSFVKQKEFIKDRIAGQAAASQWCAACPF